MVFTRPQESTLEVARNERGRAPDPGRGVPPAGGPAVALTPSALMALQRSAGNRAVAEVLTAQRHCYSAYDSYAEAKKANAYSHELLDLQKGRINQYERKLFKPDQIKRILDVNREENRGSIRSDVPPRIKLRRQKMAVVPHVDHRYPKSRGGTNSFANAAVLPAGENISKSNSLLLATEPVTPLPPYATLDDNAYTVGHYRDYAADQKKEIYKANRAHNAGVVRSDTPARKVLTNVDISKVPHVDHVLARSDGGCAFYFNAAVLPGDKNIAKGGVRGADNDTDFEVGEMTLKKYYREKRKGRVV